MSCQSHPGVKQQLRMSNERDEHIKQFGGGSSHEVRPEDEMLFWEFGGSKYPITSTQLVEDEHYFFLGKSAIELLPI